jgi:hypothetical protein
MPYCSNPLRPEVGLLQQRIGHALGRAVEFGIRQRAVPGRQREAVGMLQHLRAKALSKSRECSKQAMPQKNAETQYVRRRTIMRTMTWSRRLQECR